MLTATATKNQRTNGQSTSTIFPGKTFDKQRRDGSSKPFKKLLSEQNKKLDELQQIETALQTRLPQLLKKDTTSVGVSGTGKRAEHTKATVAFSLLGDLIDECIYDVTFQAHRDMKKSNSQCQICQTKCCCYVTKPGLDVFGNSFTTNNLPYYECVNCNKVISSSRYAPHLEKCLGLAGRSSSRVANQRLGSSSPAHNEGESLERKRKKDSHARQYDIQTEVSLVTNADGMQKRKKKPILDKKQRTMPLPLITSRDSFIDSLQDAPSSTDGALHPGVSTTSTDSNGDKIGSTHAITKTPSSCENKKDHQHNAAASEVVVQQTMSTSLQSSTLSDSCSDDFVNEPMHSPPTPPTELKTDLDGDFETNETLLSGEPDIPIVLDGGEEDQLSVTMLALYKDLLPTRESYNRRMGLVQRIEHLLNTEWPDRNIKANLFGSSVNDLGTSQSDVDLCITTSWNGLRNVRLLAKLFRRCGMQHVVCVPRAKVPIVRLFDSESQLACDMNVNNTMALENTKMIRTYVAIDPRVRPLAMIIKHWTKQRTLNDAADGGTLSSYTWTCMIINFLQMRQPPILPVLHQLKNGSINGNDQVHSNNDDTTTKDMFCSDMEKLEGFGQANHESLGGLLFAFFRRYAIEFDYDDQVVSVRHGRYLNKREKGWHIGRNKTSLCVEEPFNVTRNLGNSADVRSVQGIRMELNRAMEMLVAGVPWNYVCTPYEPLSIGSLTSVGLSPPVYYSSTLSPCDISSDVNNTNHSSYSKTTSSNSKHLHSATPKHQPIYFQPSYSTEANYLVDLHPYERRKSMSYTQRPYDFDQPPLSYRLHTINQGFHKRNGTSLPALMETIPVSQQQLGDAKLIPTHGNTYSKDVTTDFTGNSNLYTAYTTPSSTSSASSLTPQHQLISIPSEQNRTVDAIFARYHRNHPRYHSSQEMTQIPQQPQQSRHLHQQAHTYHPSHPSDQIQQHPPRSGNTGKRTPSRRRSSQSSTTNSGKTKSTNNSNNVSDWPTISQHLKSSSNTGIGHELHTDSVQQQRRRRWSTTKKATALSSPESSAISNSSTTSSTIEIKLPPKERTLADIVKVDGNKSRPTTTTSVPNNNGIGSGGGSSSSRSGHKQRGQQHPSSGTYMHSNSLAVPSTSLSTTSNTSSTSSSSSSSSPPRGGTGNRQTQQHHRYGSANKSSPSRSRRKHKD